MIDVLTFKTKRCTILHNNFNPFELSCTGFHSKEDRRRPPFIDGLLQYDALYDGGCDGTACLTYTEYLFHPHIYKTKQCGDVARWEQNGPCTDTYCPYLHENEIIEMGELRQCRRVSDRCNDEQHSRLMVMLGTLQQTREMGMKKTGRVDRVDIMGQIEEAKGRLMGRLATEKEWMERDGRRRMQASSSEAPLYQDYPYFNYGEKLPIIEDRNHEFKNYQNITSQETINIVMRYITSFLNSEGGILYLGIDDKSVVTGVRMTQGEFDKFLLAVDRQGKFNMQPPLMPQKYSIRQVPVEGKKGCWVVEVRVAKQRALTTYNRDCYMRMTSSTHKLDAVSLFELMRMKDSDPLECIGKIHRAIDEGYALTPQQTAYLQAELKRAAARLGKSKVIYEEKK